MKQIIKLSAFLLALVLMNSLTSCQPQSLYNYQCDFYRYDVLAEDTLFVGTQNFTNSQTTPQQMESYLNSSVTVNPGAWVKCY